MSSSETEDPHKRTSIQRIQFLNLIGKRDKIETIPDEERNKLNDSAALKSVFDEFDSRFQKYPRRIQVVLFASTIATFVAARKYWGPFGLISRQSLLCVAVPIMTASAYRSYALHSVVKAIHPRISELMESPEIARLANTDMVQRLLASESENADGK